VNERERSRWDSAARTGRACGRTNRRHGSTTRAAALRRDQRVEGGEPAGNEISRGRYWRLGTVDAAGTNGADSEGGTAQATGTPGGRGVEGKARELCVYGRRERGEPQAKPPAPGRRPSALVTRATDHPWLHAPRCTLSPAIDTRCVPSPPAACGLLRRRRAAGRCCVALHRNE
jgi:hypothetical protein